MKSYKEFINEVARTGKPPKSIIKLVKAQAAKGKKEDELATMFKTSTAEIRAILDESNSEQMGYRNATKQELSMMKKVMVKDTGMKWRIKYDDEDSLLMAAGRVELYPQLTGGQWELTYYGQYNTQHETMDRNLRKATKDMAQKVLDQS